MISKIRILEDNLINQIAAGEVIEDSSSVIKELLENSLDANSSEILVETWQAGRQLIKISDNGIGMSNDDALLCFERHATSKIKESKDLNELFTLGFRGEALAAISSISKMTLLTCDSHSNEGTFIKNEAGKILKCIKAPRAKGTTIEVQSLFYNVPVRKNFQKSVLSDLSSIHKILASISFANPSLAINWINDQKTELHLVPRGEDFFYNLKQNILSTQGQELEQNLIFLDHQTKECHLKGYISKPSFHRPNKTGQHLFINQRPVISPFVAQTINQGYGTRLPDKRHPLFVLHLNVPPQWVDHNVHPQKKEVRLSNESVLFSFIIQAIEQTLQKEYEVPLSYYPKEKSIPYEIPTQTSLLWLAEKPADYSIATPTPELNLKKCPKILMTWENFIFLDAFFLNPAFEKQIAVFEQRTLEAELFCLRLRSQTKLPTQILLLAKNLELSNSQLNILKELQPYFEKMGFEWNFMGGNSVFIEGIPQTLELENVEDFVFKMIEEFKEVNIEKEAQLFFQKKTLTLLKKTLRKKWISEELAKNMIDEFANLQTDFTGVAGSTLYHLISYKELSKKWE